LNHTTAPLDLRGRFAFAIDQIAPTLQSLRHSFGPQRHPDVEAAIISTCNRTEIYCAADRLALDHTVEWLAESGGVAPTPSASRAASIRWCWARPRSSAR
jgi:glutamyl-tRNA reductase